MVFQSYALFPHMTVAENIAFGLVVRDVPRSNIEERVRAAAELVGMHDELSRHPRELSGGGRQRVALARALVREPDVFLLDEPLSNLDPELRVDVRGELRRLHEQVGGTTLHVTHDHVEALVLGDRVAVLNDGLLQQIGSPDQVWERPANRFVARFLGSRAMNLMSSEGPLRPAGLPEGRALEIGVRPEDIRLGPEGVRGRVTLVERAGPDAFVHIDVDGAELVARVRTESCPIAGDEVAASVDPRHIHLFDAETGERVEWS